MFFVAIFLISLDLFAIEGFEDSSNPNIFSIGNSLSFGTASLIRLPSNQLVLATQAHVWQDLSDQPSVGLFGHKSRGPFFITHSQSSDSWEMNIFPEVLWQDDDLDMVFFKVPEGLLALCKCLGLSVANQLSEDVFVVGYPSLGRRVFPLKHRLFGSFKSLFSIVKQRISKGHLWQDNQVYYSDADALPGNSGSPILNPNGEVVGMLKILKTWYGVGYRYSNPSIEVTPFNKIYEHFLKAKH